MNATQAIEKITELGYNYSYQLAKTGSVYMNVNSIQFRISDHEQPSHYQVRNYIDCMSFDEMIEKIEDGKCFEKEKQYYTDENGITYEVIYDSKYDSFDYIQIS